jgi:GNAT superfamily N-acetyltransferase
MSNPIQSGAADGGGPPSVVVRRSRDPEVIARVLEEEYFDDPIRSFPSGLKRAFAAEWCAARGDVYFVTAEVDGRPAGFVLGHAMGDQLVRLFGRSKPRHLPALVLTYLRLRLAPGGPSSEAAVVPEDTARVDAEFAALGIPEDARPFAWSADARAARIALLSVNRAYRGHSLARRLLDCVADEMAADGLDAVEAHIEPYNLSSVRAFLKSGYELRRMAGKDFFARRRLAG